MRFGPVVLFVAMLALGFRADASDLDRALAAQDYPLARSLSESGAEKGDAHSQYILGSMLVNGNGGQQDVELGAEWLEKAGRQRHGEAMGLLGLLHYYKRLPNSQVSQAWKNFRIAHYLGVESSSSMAALILDEMSQDEIDLGIVEFRKWQSETGIRFD